MRKHLLMGMGSLMIAALILAACGPAAPVIQTQVVPVVQTQVVPVVETQLARETQIVVETQIVAATPEPGDVVYERSQTLYVSGAAWGPPSTWNPFQPGSLANTTGTIGYLYEFLFAYDPLSDTMTPWLAESGEWTDDATFVVTLRDGPTPIETTEGWLVFYHGVLTSCNGFVYSFGAALLDLDQPWKVIYRGAPYLISPQTLYECVGDVPNVTFPGAALTDAETGRLAIYYGCADTVTGLAFGHVDDVLAFLKANHD